MPSDPLAPYYDRIYSWKDYPAEVQTLLDMLASRGCVGGTLLDVACGTGKHLEQLRASFQCEGVELSPEMAAIGQARLPDVPITVGDMRDFALGRTFDVVTCLFSSIGYMTDLADLHQAIATMARHVKQGGWLVVEPWFFPHQFHDGYIDGDFYDGEDAKIARVARSWCDGPIGVVELHHLIGENGTVWSHLQTLRMGLFTDYEYRTAFESAGLTVDHDPTGLMGRGLYVGRKWWAVSL